jgi:calcineurin-like phosphoesterase family protein
MVERWNEKVGKGDIVYHLGDFWFGNAQTAYNAMKIWSRLNGQKQLICGNHDGKIVKSLPWVWVGDYKRIKFDRQAVILFHFSIRAWHHREKGSWHLYGHSHGNLAVPEPQKAFDVGVDCNNFAPVSWDEVQQRMEMI